MYVAIYGMYIQHIKLCKKGHGCDTVNKVIILIINGAYAMHYLYIIKRCVGCNSIYNKTSVCRANVARSTLFSVGLRIASCNWWMRYRYIGNSKFLDIDKKQIFDISTPQAASIYRKRYIGNSKWRRYIDLSIYRELN